MSMNDQEKELIAIVFGNDPVPEGSVLPHPYDVATRYFTVRAAQLGVQALEVDPDAVGGRVDDFLSTLPQFLESDDPINTRQ